MQLIVRVPIDGIQDMQQRLHRAAPAWRVIGQRLRGSILRNFRRQGWFPKIWQRSAAAAARHGQTLVETAYLRNSMHATSGDSWAAAGTDKLVYAAIHQYGGRTGRNHAVSLPARPYLPIDAAGNLHSSDSRFISAVLGNWIIHGRAAP